MKKTVVVIDDNPDLRLLAQLTLEAGGDYDVVALATMEELEGLDPPPVPDVMVLDNRMPVTGGTQAAARILADHPDLPIVLFSAFLDAELEGQAAAIGIAACLAKTDYQRLPELLDELTSRPGTARRPTT